MNLPFFHKKEENTPNNPGTNPSKGNILLCENDPFYSQAITVLLQQCGYQVVVAGQVSDALSLVKTTTFKLILCAVEFEGGGGFSLISQVKLDSSLKKIPFIFLTDVSDSSSIERATSLGATDYFIKSNSGVAHLKELVLEHLKP